MPFDAIVIGTGFGGTVAAAALHAAGKTNVLMLERGTWWITPETLGKPPAPAQPPKPSIPEYAAAQQPPETVQYWPRPDHARGLADFLAAIRSTANKKGLYQYSIFKEAHILTANGVGGGSLIYSNVNLRPKDEVLNGIGLNLTQPDFDKSRTFMEKYRGKLNKVVTKIPLPGKNVDSLGPDEDYLYLDRSRGLRDASTVALPKLKQELGVDFTVTDEWKPLELSLVEYEEDPITHKATGDGAATHTNCERQGRCILGCLPAARHTLNKTLFAGHKFQGQLFGGYIRDPNSGVTLAPQAKVLHIKRVGANYEVTYEDHRNDQTQTATAPLVFLAAGVLGTTEILLRSRDKGFLNLSKTIGSHFSTNGDFAAFAVGTKNAVWTTRGPINTSDIRVKFETPGNPSPFTGTWITVEDCGIPAMLASVVKGSLETTNPQAFAQQMKDLMSPNFFTALRNLFPDTTSPGNFQTEAEMLSNIFFFNAMGTDDASGRFSLNHDDLDLNWPANNPIAKNPVFGKIEKLLRELTAAMGASYVSNPLWDKFGDKKLIITHPLGGAPIAPTVADGVVDDFGRVFDGSKQPGAADPFLPGLFVVDGAAIPGALACNPTLTIAAQAIKTVENALGVTL